MDLIDSRSPAQCGNPEFPLQPRTRDQAGPSPSRASRPEGAMSDRSKGDRATGKGIQSVEIGYELLVTLSKLAEPASLTDIALANAMTPSKAYFYLTSLVRVGLVHKQAED
eukprot:gene26949-29649_t